MAESDESGKSRAMPPPELNPLLNPTLNKNLTRWAEVYFKSPPENRDEAVRELLRELEGGDSQLLAAAPDSSRPEESPANGSGPSTGAVQTSICPSCGFDTRPNQKFCGRCGARLGSPPNPSDARSEDRAPRFIPPPVPDRQPVSTAPGSFQPDEDEEPWFLQQQESVPFWYSYRLYIGAGFAILVLYLGYVAWQGAKAAPHASKLPEQVPTVQASPGVAEEPPAASPPAAAAPSPPPGTSSNPPAEPVPPETQTLPGATSGARAGNPLQADSPTPSGQADSPAASGYGAEELATARHFLDAAHPDHAVAAEWLWKSVAKQNTEATLLLGQLYLRGQGVQKNCEQGRVLLDAAAKKGSKDAASLLRNLQAFGCQ